MVGVSSSTQALIISSTHPTLHLSQPTLDSFIWNSLIRRPHQPPSPLSLYLLMRRHSVLPDFHTFPFLIPSLSHHHHHSLRLAQSLHAHTLLFALSTHPFTLTSLISLYSSSHSLNDAQKLFDEMPQPDIPAYTAIIHANCKAGMIGIARKLFDKMSEKNVVSYSCMINGYVKSGMNITALALFHDLLALKGGEVRPNEFTMSSVLSACARLGALEHGKWVHAYVDRCRMRINVVLGTALIDMYVKCGDVERARRVFEAMGDERDVMAWTAMLSGLAMHGQSRECLEMLSRMVDSGVRPNGVTFVGVLCACVHGGLVREGNECFKRMVSEFDVSPMIQHYGCMVDLYSRAGCIGDRVFQEDGE